jgi:hypothetical protein
MESLSHLHQLVSAIILSALSASSVKSCRNSRFSGMNQQHQLENLPVVAVAHGKAVQAEHQADVLANRPAGVTARPNHGVNQPNRLEARHAKQHRPHDTSR